MTDEQLKLALFQQTGSIWQAQQAFDWIKGRMPEVNEKAPTQLERAGDVPEQS